MTEALKLLDRACIEDDVRDESIFWLDVQFDWAAFLRLDPTATGLARFFFSTAQGNRATSYREGGSGRPWGIADRQLTHVR